MAIYGLLLMSDITHVADVYMSFYRCVALFCPSGKHEHRGGSPLLGGAHPEQRGEPADRAEPQQPGSVWVQ